MEDNNTNFYFLMGYNRNTKQEYILKVLKVALENLLGVAVKYHKEVGMVDTFGKTLVFGSWMHE